VPMRRSPGDFTNAVENQKKNTLSTAGTVSREQISGGPLSGFLVTWAGRAGFAGGGGPLTFILPIRDLTEAPLAFGRKPAGGAPPILFRRVWSRSPRRGGVTTSANQEARRPCPLTAP